MRSATGRSPGCPLTDWDAVDRAEERLESRSVARRTQLERRDRRRRWLPFLLAPLVLPALGAAALLAVVEQAGGDLSGWPFARAVAVVAAAFLVPAALSAWLARREGIALALLWAVICAAAQLALVVGVGFLALDLGPA
jgi:hypothetical protein